MNMDRLKPVADVATLSTTVAALAGWLPSIAALVSILWGLIRIIETRTVQRWLRGRNHPCANCKKAGKAEDQ